MPATFLVVTSQRTVLSLTHDAQGSPAPAVRPRTSAAQRPRNPVPWERCSSFSSSPHRLPQRAEGKWDESLRKTRAPGKQERRRLCQEQDDDRFHHETNNATSFIGFYPKLFGLLSSWSPVNALNSYC